MTGLRQPPPPPLKKKSPPLCAVPRPRRGTLTNLVTLNTHLLHHALGCSSLMSTFLAIPDSAARRTPSAPWSSSSGVTKRRSCYSAQDAPSQANHSHRPRPSTTSFRYGPIILVTWSNTSNTLQTHVTHERSGVGVSFVSRVIITSRCNMQRRC